MKPALFSDEDVKPAAPPPKPVKYRIRYWNEPGDTNWWLISFELTPQGPGRMRQDWDQAGPSRALLFNTRPEAEAVRDELMRAATGFKRTEIEEVP